MKKTFMTITTVAVVGLSSAFFGNTVQADTLSDLETKQSEVKSERETVKKDLSKAESKIADVLFDLKEINQEIVRVTDVLEENQSMLKKAKKDVKKTETEIKEIEKEIEELEEGIEERNEILKKRLTSYQKSGGDIGFLEVIFGSKNFDEFISRASAVSKITDSDAALIQEQEDDKEKVEENQEKVEEKLAEQKEMEVELVGMQELILDQKKETEKNKKSLEKKEKELTALKADLEGKDTSLASLEKEVRQDIAAAKAPTPAPAQETQTASSETPSNNTATSASNDGELVTLSKEEKKEEPAKTTPKPNSGGGNKSVAINAGYDHLGTPYKWAGKGPGGFDCSGFVSWAYSQAGYSIPSNTSGLSATGTKVSYSDVQPGDLVFFNTYKTNGHVGIYVGNGQFIGAQNSTGLAVATMTSGYWKDKFAGHVRRIN